MDTNGSACPGTTAPDVAPETLLAAVIEMSDDAVFTCDRAGMVTTWGATAERLFGRRVGEVLAGPVDVLFPEHLRDEVQTLIATVLAGDRVNRFETEVQRPDGMPVPVSLSLCPLFDAAGTPAGSAVLARDVTEQRLAQGTLAEVETRLEEAEALAHVGSWMWDLRTGTVQWSAEFHRIHGIDPLAFDGTFESYLGLIHAGDRRAVRVAMEQSVRSGRPFEGEYRVQRPDEQVRIVQVRAEATIGSAGTVVGLRGVGQDVTERAGADAHPGPRDI